MARTRIWFAVPYMLGHAMPGWLMAFLAVAMFASFMSTQDSYLFCWSSIISRDVIGPLTGKVDAEGFQKLVTRIGIFLIALYELYWGLIYQGKEDIWDYSRPSSGSIYFCSGIVLMAGGLYWRRATRRGALWALILGFSAIAGLGPIKDRAGARWLVRPRNRFRRYRFVDLGTGHRVIDRQAAERRKGIVRRADTTWRTWTTLWAATLWGSAGAFLLVTLYIAATSFKELFARGDDGGDG